MVSLPSPLSWRALDWEDLEARGGVDGLVRLVVEK
jgi:hypothetical protein